MNQIWQDISNAFTTFDIRVWAKNLVASHPPATWSFQWPYLAFAGVLLLAGIVFLFLRRMHPPLRERWLSFFWSNALICGILYFFRWQRVPYLGTDLLRVAHEVFMLFWFNSIIWYRRTGYKKELLAQVVEARRNQYLPKPKS